MPNADRCWLMKGYSCAAERQKAIHIYQSAGLGDKGHVFEQQRTDQLAKAASGVKERNLPLYEKWFKAHFPNMEYHLPHRG